MLLCQKNNDHLTIVLKEFELNLLKLQSNMI